VRSRLTILAWLLAALPTALLAQTAESEKYLAFGDSITEGIGDTNAGETGYPTRLQALLRQGGKDGVKVVNHGRKGENTVQGLSRIDSILKSGGDVILIMEGSNDILDKISTGTTVFNLQQMLDRAEAAGVEPFWASIVPFRPSAFTTEDQELAIEMRQKSNSGSLALIDCYAAFDYFPGAWPDLYNQSLKRDPVGHPNGKGYDVIAQVFADVILGNDTLPPVLGPVDQPDGQENVSATKRVEVVVFDLEDGIDNAATTMIVDGEAVAAQRTGSASRSTYSYTPPQPWGNVVNVEMDLQDLAGNAVRVDATRFIIKGAKFFKGDINKDGRVDGFDLVLLAFSFGAGQGNSRYRTEHDLDKDGFVGGSDLAILASNFGKGA